MSHRPFSLFAVALLFLACSAHAEFYKCVEDGTGKISFSDVPCHGKDSGGRIVVRPTNQADGSVNRRKAAEDRWDDAQRSARRAEEAPSQASNASSKGQDACAAARKSLTDVAESYKKDPAEIKAKKSAMYVACGIPEPPTVNVQSPPMRRCADKDDWNCVR